MTRSTRRALTWSLLIFMVAGVAAVWLLVAGGSKCRWFSAADQARPWAWADWNELHRAGAGVSPAGAPLLGRLADLDWTDKKLEVRYPSVDDGFAWPVEVIRIGEGKEFVDGSRSARLECLAVSRPDLEMVMTPGGVMRAPFRIHDPVSHELLEGAQLGTLGREFRGQTAHFHANRGPRLGLGLATSGFDQPHWDSMRVHDARTRVMLSGGNNFTVTNDGTFVGSCEVRAWHPAPVLVALDLLHGPSHSAPVPLEKDAVIKLGDARMRIVAVREAAACQSWSRSGGTGEPNLVSLNTRASKKRATFLVVEQWPAEQFDGVTWRVLDHDGGKVWAQTHCGVGDPVGVYAFQGAMDRIKSVEVTLRSHRTRFLLDLREIPGMPEENRGVDNLFDVRVPSFARMDGDWAMCELIAGLVQCQHHGYGSSVPVGTMPHPFDGSTPEQLGQLWESIHRDEKIEVPEGSGVIHFGSAPAGSGMFQRLGSALRRLMP